jgi:Tfp pilus assembly protein PilW
MKPSTLRVILVALPLALGAPVALVAGGCGQLTGLSNDYTYDLSEGGDASSDGAVDAAADAADASDAGKCSAAAAATTATKLAQTNGSAVCEACLASSCCTSVDSCVAVASCKSHFFCLLDCTSIQAANDRASCVKNCSNGGSSATPLFTNGVGQCAGVACKTECGF